MARTVFLSRFEWGRRSKRSVIAESVMRLQAVLHSCPLAQQVAVLYDITATGASILTFPYLDFGQSVSSGHPRCL